MPYNLTPRELEVLRALGRAEHDLAAANLLFISVLTVRAHVQHITAKMGVLTPEEAIARARREGLI